MRASPDSALVLSPQQAARATAAFRAAVNRAGSQKVLAGALGISQQAVSEACRGRVSLGLAALLSMWLGVGVRDVLEEPEVTAVPVMPPMAAAATSLLAALGEVAADLRAPVLEGALDAAWREGWAARESAATRGQEK